MLVLRQKIRQQFAFMPRRTLVDVNLASIAKEIGISPSTVSRALRDQPSVHPATRARIKEVAEAMGYGAWPKKNAEGTQPHHFMALAQTRSSGSKDRYLAGISKAAVFLNACIHSHHLPPEDCEHILHRGSQPVAMSTDMIEGLVLIHQWPLEIASRLAAKWPTVSIVHHYPKAPIDLIGIEERTGVRTLVAHLQAAGRRKLGFFGLCPTVSWSASRYAAYVEAMVCLDLPFDPALTIRIPADEAMFPGTFPPGEWAQTVLEKSRNGAVDAWVCPSEMTGYSLVDFLLAQGISIPGQIAVTGFHSQYAIPAGLPRLTSIDVPDEELGAAAGRRLVYRVNHRAESPRSILISGKFIQGGTTPEYGDNSHTSHASHGSHGRSGACKALLPSFPADSPSKKTVGVFRCFPLQLS